jgi:hypothetical protein
MVCGSFMLYYCDRMFLLYTKCYLSAFSYLHHAP